MRFSKGIQLALRLRNISTNALAIEIVDIISEYQSGKKISEQDRFIAGLRYYEFYTDCNDYDLACNKQNEFLNFLNVNKEELFELVDKMFKKQLKKLFTNY